MMKLPRNHVTPELLAMIVDLIPAVKSLRDICALTGLNLDVVRRETAPFLAIMKLNGTHPKCGCGKDRFHRYGCADLKLANAIPGQRAADHARLFARRQNIIAMLIAGDRFVDVNDVLGLHDKAARRYLRFMTPAQIAERERNLRYRLSVEGKRRNPPVRNVGAGA